MKIFLQNNWKLVLLLNLVLGISLWFGFFTDVSLRGTIPDLLFPPIVALFAFITTGTLPREKKRFLRMAYWPSLLGGFLHVFLVLILIIPPFTLGFLFAAGEISSEVKIQQIESPNKINIVDVYFRPVGAYASGSGRISIRLVNKYLPFVERDIYAGKTSTASEETTIYVKWLDNNTLYLQENGETIKIGKIESETPMIAIVPMMVIGFIDQQIKESQLSRPLRTVPIYPVNVGNGSTSVYGLGEEAFAHRVFFLHQTDLGMVYKWYLAELSTAPWKILEIVESTILRNRTEYCMKTQKSDGETATLFYWTIDDSQGTSDARIIRVTVSTPYSHNIPCSP